MLKRQLGLGAGTLALGALMEERGEEGGGTFLPWKKTTFPK